MKASASIKFGVISCAFLGTVMVVTSQPGTQGGQTGGFPSGIGGVRHNLIREKVTMAQVQEFKDAATLHLNDVQKGLTEGRKVSTSTNYIAQTIYRDVFDKYITRIPFDRIAAAPGGGPTVARMTTPAELAALYYTFDQGVDILAKKHAGQMGNIGSNPLYIEGKITPKDLDMTPDQFKLSVMQYVEVNHMRFWNEARVGLASGR